MTNRTAINLIKLHLRRELFMPEKNWPDEKIEERLYSRAAVKEILRELNEHPTTSPIFVVWCFIESSCQSAHSASDDRVSDIYTLCENVGTDVLSILLKGEWSNEG